MATKKTTHKNNNFGVNAAGQYDRGTTDQGKNGNMTTRRETNLTTGVQSASKMEGKNGTSYYRSKSAGEKQVSGRVRTKKTAAQIRAQMKRIEEGRANSGLGASIDKALNAGNAALGYKSLGLGVG